LRKNHDEKTQAKPPTRKQKRISSNPIMYTKIRFGFHISGINACATNACGIARKLLSIIKRRWSLKIV
jgi:hypothetical protein